MTSRIYQGEVTHARFAPVKHTFCYPVYFYAFDLDDLAQLDQRSSLFGYNRLRPVAIHDRDYLMPGDEPLREKLAGVMEKAGWSVSLFRVMLVTAARYFNYIFNPISFFYCYGPDNSLEAIVAQVNNTFGEMHLYLLSPDAMQEVDGQMRFGTEKAFHVSPFFPRRGRYEFRLTLPAEELDNAIHYHLDEQLSLVARIRGSAESLTPAALARNVIRHPACASLTMPRILWQAAKLYYIRRLNVFERPVPDSEMTIRPVPATRLDRVGMQMVLKFLSRLPEGELLLTTPDGREYRFGTAGAEPCVELHVRDFRFFRRVMFSGDIGFGEAYTDGDWSTSDLPGLLTLLARNEAAMDDRSILTAAVGRVVNYLRHLRRANTVRGSSRNIREHYDLSNDFFQTFLDPTMTYSCAIFASPEETLEQAQHNKLQTIIDKAQLSDTDHVLEIGCGWGAFAIEAVRKSGCRVTGITISDEQFHLARKRVRDAGLEDRIEIRRCDYRHIEGRYSRVVSIEMLEAVGHAGLEPFFSACDKALLPGGRAVVQVITIPDRKYDAYRFSSDWIRKHIFPGGHLPSVGAMRQAMANGSSLKLEGLENYAADYARTLERWRLTLLEKQQEVRGLGFDDRFIRTWEYYFCYCEAGFNARIIDLAQMVLDKPGVSE